MKNLLFKLLCVLWLIPGVIALSPVMAASVMADTPQPPERLLQSIVHGLDYLSVDYPNVVKNGEILDEAEYAEQMEIAEHALSQMQLLPSNPQKPHLVQNARTLHDAVQQKAFPDQVADLCRDTIALLISSYQIKITPPAIPSLAEGQQLFSENCVACHGANGFGDGVQAAALDPKPANFHDRERQQHRSIYGLFNTISLGVEGTAMPSFSQLSAQQRWSLAFYVSNYYANPSEVAHGEAVWKNGEFVNVFNGLQPLVQAKPMEVAEQWGQNGVDVLAYLRSNPKALQGMVIAPLDVARQKLADSIAAYKQDKKQIAYERALAAYFEGFELSEAKLKTVAPELRVRIEKEMMQFRDMVKRQVTDKQLEQQQLTLLNLLDEADRKLNTSGASKSVNFVTSLLILLREGLEAILVLAAIVAVLVKAGRRDALAYIHAGWIGALLLGILTWYAAGHFIEIDGANREMTEGITALIAAAMLFYVGFWLHNQSNAVQWKKFVSTKINSSLSTGALSGLAVIAFIAVYREVFESVLFYQSLMLNSGPGEQGYIIAGILVAAAILVLLAWLIMRYSVRLPLRTFFRVNMVLMFLIAVVFAGKGVAALQEAGVFPVDPINFPEIDLLGIYPNLESLGLQLLLIVVALSWWLYGYLKMDRLKL